MQDQIKNPEEFLNYLNEAQKKGYRAMTDSIKERIEKCEIGMSSVSIRKDGNIILYYPKQLLLMSYNFKTGKAFTNHNILRPQRFGRENALYLASECKNGFGDYPVLGTPQLFYTKLLAQSKAELEEVQAQWRDAVERIWKPKFLEDQKLNEK